MSIVDREGRIIAILAGCLSDESWPELARQAAEALEEGRVRCNMVEERTRRGVFPALQAGFSHRGGRKEPINFTQRSKHRQALVADLNRHELFRRISGFTNSKSPSLPPVTLLLTTEWPQVFL